MIRIEKIEKLSKKELALWQGLWDRVPNAHFFNSPQYLLAFLDCFAVESQVFFCWQERELVAVLPLIESRKYGISVWVCPDRPQRFLDRSALLLDQTKKGIFEEIVQKIGSEKNLFLADLEEGVIEKGEKKPEGLVEFETVCPKTKICQDPLGGMKAKQKREMRRRMRKLGKDFVFRFYEKVQSGQLEEMEKIEAKSAKSEKKIALFENEESKRLYASFLKNCPDNCAVGFLCVGEEKIAHAFGFVCKKTFLCTHMAFDKKYSKFAPGKILVCKLLEELCRKEFELFDFSKGESRLKSEFMTLFPVQYNFYYSKNSFILLWWKTVLATKKTAKQLLKKFR